MYSDASRQSIYGSLCILLRLNEIYDRYIVYDIKLGGSRQRSRYCNSQESRDGNDTGISISLSSLEI